VFETNKKVQVFDDEFGNLRTLNFSEIPFSVKRLYWISCVPRYAVRGRHAHKTLEQFFIMLSGSVNLVLKNHKFETTLKLTVDSPIIVLMSGVWRELSEFSSNAVLMVGASEEYDESDYIRDWDEYVNWLEKQ
jgi:hypothetical protein